MSHFVEWSETFRCVKYAQNLEIREGQILFQSRVVDQGTQVAGVSLTLLSVTGYAELMAAWVHWSYKNEYLAQEFMFVWPGKYS